MVGAARPETGFAYLDEAPGAGFVAMAHRGGAAHPDLAGLENTVAAFRHAVDLGYTYLETDVHLTGHGELVAFHDDVLDRVSDGTGPVAQASAEVIAATRIAGAHRIPLLAELLEEFPEARFNIDLKADGSAAALVDLLRRTGACERVCVGSFSGARLAEFRRLSEGTVATSASSVEVGQFLVLPVAALRRVVARRRLAVLQVPYRHRGVPVVTGRLVRRAHAAGVHVHVWTIDDRAEMEQLLALGVDGLITDRTDVLKDLLVARGLWGGRS